jgi:hypothetical protein
VAEDAVFSFLNWATQIGVAFLFEQAVRSIQN